MSATASVSSFLVSSFLISHILSDPLLYLHVGFVGSDDRGGFRQDTYFISVGAFISVDIDVVVGWILTMPKETSQLTLF